MARTITAIQNEMFAAIAANENLSGLNSTSNVAIYRLFVYIVAFAIWLHESFFDQHTLEINEKLANQKSGTKPWYRFMALQFQYGFDLVPDKDYFDNGNATAEEIAASKIIKYSAVNEAQDSSRVILKIAGETDGVLTDFDDPAQVEAIEAYIDEIRVAGVQVTIINYKADQLYLNIRIKRDPLVLNEMGMSKLMGNYPVNEALQEFMKELDFNGELKLSALIDKLQVIPGIVDATVLSASSAWIDPALDGYGIPQPIFISKIAESGYFEIVNFDNIAYVV
ncbi:MAG: nucleotidyltransferase [Bacteroidota bacterium]